jgi:hypothetical protein
VTGSTWVAPKALLKERQLVGLTASGSAGSSDFSQAVARAARSAVYLVLCLVDSMGETRAESSAAYLVSC